ncbi:hypothetical protein DESUT3_09630 [Desulfuromonas versatilis]|uniref:TPM domain-containing protein n=1 Tax=Desulfuromonas versatilis TaxID=2802975 RepID=A0ABM8HN08_9BACT|nr:TPM domain-containing protein [Desulfuromonas versatilis]BCR03894.1 hypothetical protein DESUT3_09630 [Desulfuromonas versatilis]
MMKMTARTFFTEEEKHRIEMAVQEAESRTSGEIVPMLVDASYDYPRAEIVGGGIFATATAGLIAWWLGHSSMWVFLPMFLPLYFLFKLILRQSPGLKRRLIHPDEMAAEVEEKALLSFYEQGLQHTRDQTGVLILISLLEHRVFVLADRGINQRVPPETWDEMVRTITLGIRDGHACEALCAAIRHCGDLLEEQFPRKADDTDELPNLILE